MQSELVEILETAIYKEVASQAVYEAGQRQTGDAGAQTLMAELALEEEHHADILWGLKERGWEPDGWHSNGVQNLKISDYLVAPERLQGATLQDTLSFALKREQQSVDFYSRLMAVMRGAEAKALCERLVHEELKHKQKLELLYDDLFYEED